MKKIMRFAAAVLWLAVLPMAAQEIEENAEEPSEPKITDKKSAANQKAPPKKTEFSGQQEKIEMLMKRLPKAKKSSEKHRIADQIRREQNNLKLMLKRKVDPLRNRINPLKEQIRLTSPARREKLKKELDQLEEEIKTLKEDAALEKWCKAEESDEKKADGGLSDSGRKRKRSKRKK